MNKIRFVLVGCGRVGWHHIKAIMENDDAELVAICDKTYDKTTQYSERIKNEYGLIVSQFDNVTNLLQQSNFDVACIAVEPFNHYAVAKEILESNKNVILEKPITLIPEQGQELIDIAKERNLKFTVCHQNRFNWTLQKLKNSLPKDFKCFECDSAIFWNRDQGYYEKEYWYGINEHKGGHLLGAGGGTLMNQGIHVVDLMLWLNGKVSSVKGYGGTLNHNIKVDDCIKAILKYDNGSVGTLTVTTCTQPRNFEETLFISGKQGSVKIGGVALNKFERFKLDTFNETDEQEILAVDNEPPTVYGFGHGGVIKNMVQCIKDNKEPYIKPEEALQALKTTLAIYDSVYTNEEVELK